MSLWTLLIVSVRWLIPLSCTQEISDDLMSTMSSLFMSSLPSEAESALQKAYVTYAFPRNLADDSIEDDRTVTLLEARSVISSLGTTGLRTWEAALFLGSYVASEDGQMLIRGKKVLELGAGTGMLSILSAKHLETSGIVATDGDEAVVDAIKTNFFLNGLDIDDSSKSVVRAAALKWGRPVNATTFAEDYGMGVPDVLLGADVVSSTILLINPRLPLTRWQTYDKLVIPRLVHTLSEFFVLNPALEVLIAATIRNEQTFETFLNACSGSSNSETAALRVDDVLLTCGVERNKLEFAEVEFSPVPEQLQDGPFYPTSTPIQIWRVTKGQISGDPFAF